MSHSDLQKGRSKAHDTHYALVNFLSIFASVENKGSLGYIPKLVIRIRFPSPAPIYPVIVRLKLQKYLETSETFRKLSLYVTVSL
jgi:hypothetical protein